MKTASLAIILTSVALMNPGFIWAASGSAVECSVAQTCKVGEFLYNDEYVPITSATCTVTSKYPDGTAFLSGVAMTAGADGWYSYSFTAGTTTGYYPTQVCCTSGSDYLCLDKSIEIIAANLTASGVAAEVWGYSGRTLTGFGSLVTDIWNNSDREVTNLGTVVRDVWGYTSRTLTGTSTTTTTDADLSAQMKDIRLQLEKLVNLPIIENSLEEETPDLGEKIENSDQRLSELYIDSQYAVGRMGLMALKWDVLSVPELITNISDVAKTLGDGGIQSEVEWLNNAWGWNETTLASDKAREARENLAAVVTILSTSGKTQAAGNVFKASLVSLEGLEAVLGQSADEDGAQTVFGQMGQVKSLAKIWDEKEVALDGMLAVWNSTHESQLRSGSAKLAHEVITLNRIPKAEGVLTSKFADISDQKKLKNKVLGLVALVDANKSLLARGKGGYLASTWIEEGSMVFKSLVTNPSELIAQEVPLKYYLPVEVKEEDILDHDQEIEIKYDADRAQYYVEGIIKVAVGETKTIAVRVDDVWEISATDVDSIRKQTAALAEPLKNTSFFAQGVTLASDINASLDRVVSVQEAAVTPEQQIRAYREAAIEMTQAKEKLNGLQSLVAQAGSAGAMFGFVGGAQVMAVWGLIIIVVAGFVFLATYMRSIALAGGKIQQFDRVTSVTVEQKRSPLRKLAHLVLIVLVSSGVTGMLVRQVLVIGDKADAVEVSTPMVLAAQVKEESIGGPDIVFVVPPTGKPVSLRAQPDAGARETVKIAKTSEVLRMAVQSKWVKVEIDNITGWVEAEFVSENPGEAVEMEAVTREVVIGETPTGWLRVRETPKGREIAKVDTGRRYELVSEDKGWWEIRLDDGVTGWVSAEYATSGE